MEGDSVSSSGACLGARGGTGYWSWSLWDSDNGFDTWTCGIGLD